MKKRILSLLLLCAMLSACGEAAVTDDTTTAADTTEPAETELRPTLPDKTFDGRTFTVYTRDSANHNGAFTTETETGDVLNDAIFRRMQTVSETLDVTFEEVKKTGDGEGNGAKDAILSGDDAYQLLIIFSRSAIPMAGEELLMDWNDLPYVDFDQPWWVGANPKSLAVGNKIFVSIDNLTHDALGAPAGMIFNKDLFDQYNLTYPYQMVKDGKWTMDRMIELATQLSADLNGDSELKLTDDQFGVAATEWTCPQNVFVTTGQTIATVNADGLLELTLNTPRTVEMYEKYFTFAESDCYSITKGDVTDMNNAVRAGRVGFAEMSVYAISNLRDIDTEFGIIPQPKYDESVEGYRVNVGGHCNFLAVPKTVTDPEFVSAVIESICFENQKTVIPAFRERVLEGKVVRDEESMEMLDIIFESRVYDPGHLILPCFPGGGEFADIGNKLVYRPDHNFSSYYAANEKKVQSAVDKINETFA
ncbi:MAG: extracellular solute-binding protein [Ruminococcaceae bacterium]|nr:extracellular solute-binding protein [Oscillospiraceae bacterium]